MADTLIIVDSPAQKAFFEEYYSGDVEVCVSTMPVAQPTHTGNASAADEITFTFSVATNGQETATKLEDYSDKNIIVALDKDPRSEYMAWLISSYVKQLTKGGNIVKRLTLSGVSDEEVKKSFDFVSAVDDQQGVNFYTRSLFDVFLSRHLNRLVGTTRGPGNFPIQYASLSAMFLLADREMEIQMHRPKRKWQVRAELSLDGHFFGARLEEVCDLTNDGFFKEEKKARWVLDLIKDDPFVVDKIDRTPFEIQPPAPYMLTELLNDALVLCEVGPKEVLGSLRKLFHGVEVDGKISGLISSFATLENANTSGWLKKLQEEVIAKCGQDALGAGVVEPVTGMIFPLRPNLTAEHVVTLDDTEAKIYELIRCRALASQMKPAVGEHFKIEIGVGPESFFTTQFRSLSGKGFLAVYLGRYDKKLLDENPLAAIQEGQDLNIIKLIPEQTGGVAAEHYTIETLFADLAEFANMADPGNVLMLQGMINTGYIVVSEDGYLTPGDNIKKVTSIVNKAFPYMQGINLSAYIEQTIVEVTTGRKGLDSALKQFDQALISQGRPLIKAILPSMIKSRVRRSSTIIKQVESEQAEESVQDENVAQNAGRVEGDLGQSEQVARDQATSPSGEEAPSLLTDAVDLQEGSEPVEQVVDTAVHGGTDGAGTVVEEPAGELLAESASEEIMAEPLEESAFLGEEADEWPDELKEAFEAALREPDAEEATPQAAPGADQEPAAAAEKTVETDQEHICQVCGKAMLLKEDRFGKFWSCSGFPGCRHTEAFGKDAQVMYCPICREGEIVHKRTPSGKTFYVCMDPDCEFMSWAKPHYVSCQLCDSQYLVEMKSSSGKLQLRCPKAGCDYSQPLEGDESIVGEAAKPAKRKVRVRRKAGSVPMSSGGGKKVVRVVRRKKK